MSTDISQAAEKTPTDSPETTGGGRIYRPSTEATITLDVTLGSRPDNT